MDRTTQTVPVGRDALAGRTGGDAAVWGEFQEICERLSAREGINR